MTGDLVAERSDHIAALIQSKLGVRGKTLESKLRRAGRSIPKWVHKEADQLVAAQRLMAHPKLMMQADPSQLDRAYQSCERWLKTVDPAKRRKDKMLKFLATNAFNLIAVAGLFVLTLSLTGHV